MKHRLLWSGLLPVFLLLACGSAVAPPAVAPVTAVPTATAPPPTSTATAPDVQAFPLGNVISSDYAGEEQVPGWYKTPDWFSLPFTFETSGVFRGMGQRLPQGELFGLAQGQRQLPPKQLLFWTLSPDVSPEDAVSELRATPQLEFSPNQTVNVAGVSGTQFEATAEQEAAIPALGTLVGHSGPWYTNSAQVELRFIVLEIAGRTLVIYIEAPQDEFHDFAAIADQVLGTIAFDVEAASATASEPILFPDTDACCPNFGKPLAAGHYRTPEWFAIPFLFTLGDGWRGEGEEVDNSIWIEQGGTSRSTRYLGFIPIPGDRSPDDVWAELRATPGLIVGEDADVIIAGLPAKQFDAMTDPDTEHKFEGSHVALPTLKQLMKPDAVWTVATETLNTGLRFILLPVADQHMIIYIEAPNPEFEAFTREADKVLQTLQSDAGPGLPPSRL